MAKLTSNTRNALAVSSFALPKTRAYPMPDKNHARLAKSGASHAEHVGNISKAQEKRIDAKADRVLARASMGPLRRQSKS